MTRITTTVLVMVILMNSGATIMDVSGLNDDLGVEMETGVSDAVDETVEEMKTAFDPNIGSVESLISLSLAAIGVFEIVIEGVFSAPTMMINILGGGEVVETVVLGLFAPMYAISTLELVSIAIGSRTV
ncbi:MAG: hypothetical protein RI568_13805 [Natronomonas sp.]|uniref:hypothetical protein n=1 Tax=Natronomonas sp. TaxID=2184060 RepID=UPI0028704313|nr:hypothetical protein [Natronomonas sp.]MDR9431757.1 hypothetical protein [Natronomonas sp.]